MVSTNAEDPRKRKVPKLPGQVADEAMPDDPASVYGEPMEGENPPSSSGPRTGGLVPGAVTVDDEGNVGQTPRPASSSPGMGTEYLGEGAQIAPDEAVSAASDAGVAVDTRSIDDLAEELVRQQMEAALNGGDTAEQERLIREQAADALGQGLMDSRARAGRAGSAVSGAQAALEQDAMTRSNRQVALDIIDARIAESQRLIDNALAAGRYDLAAQAQANQDALTQAKIDAFNAIIEGSPSVNTNPDDPNFGSIVNDVTHGGADVNNTQLSSTGVPDGAPVTDQPIAERDRLEAELRASGYQWETVTDDGVTIYRNQQGERLYVRYG